MKLSLLPILVLSISLASWSAPLALADSSTTATTTTQTSDTSSSDATPKKHHHHHKCCNKDGAACTNAPAQ